MNLSSFLPSGYQLKITFATLAIRSGLVFLIFFSYYVLLNAIPSNLAFHYQLVTVLVGTMAILIFLPLTEKYGRRLKNRFLSEYLTEDEESLRQAIKQFNYDTLIRNVFPDMVKITASHSGTLAVLNPSGSFEFFTYFRGRQKKIAPNRQITVKIKFQEFLKSKKNGVSLSEIGSNTEINEDFIELHANFIYPLLFREKLFGFLAVSNIPNSEALQSIALLAGQAALTIHNALLSTHIADNKKYKKEAEYADRIQFLLETGNIPAIPNWELQVLPRNHGNLVEFFQSGDDRWFFLVLNAGKKTQHVGIVLSYLIGIIFSQKRLKLIKSFPEIRQMIQQTFLKLEWKERYEYLIGKLDNAELQLLQEGVQFQVNRETDPKEVVVSVGWKNKVSFTKGAIIIKYGGQSILRINYTAKENKP